MLGQQTSRLLQQVVAQPCSGLASHPGLSLLHLSGQALSQQLSAPWIVPDASSTADHEQAGTGRQAPDNGSASWDGRLHSGASQAVTQHSCLISSLSSALGQHASSIVPSWCHQQTRAASTLPKAGIPKPRPGVENVMSTFKGGHLARSIKLTQTLIELDALLQEHEGSLMPVHWALASLQLEKLLRQEQASPTSLRIASIAARIEQAAVQAAPRLAVMHLAPIMHGLSGARHALSEASLTSLAAVLLAGQCRQLQLASDRDWKQLVWSFSRQGYSHPWFWQQLVSHAVPLMRSQSWNPNRVASIVKDLVYLGVRSEALMMQALKIMTHEMSNMKPASLVDAISAAAACYPGALSTSQPTSSPPPAAQGVDPAVLAAFGEAAIKQARATLPNFNHKQLVLLLSFLDQLGAGSKDTVATVVTLLLNKQPEVMTVVNADKLLTACASVQYSDEKLTRHVATAVLPALEAAEPEAVQRLAHSITASTAAAAGLPEVQTLLAAMQQLQTAEATTA